ncbi:MAG: NAD(P)/FAD-dependent oxidoreductase [Planctomycetota bacterium]
MADRRYDVAIIGAGIIGASVAYHLARRGCRDVAVLEKESTAGTGSTAKAAGGIRAQFSSEINVRLSLLSLPDFERFSQEMGVPAPFYQVGYLWIATRPEDARLFERNAALHRRLGMNVELLDARGVAARAPFVRTDDVLAGAFHARDGYASPADFLQGYCARAKELGVEFLYGHEVVGREGDRLLTPAGPVRASRVVLATGAWSGRVGRILGCDIPVEPVRRQCFVTQPLPELPHPVPMTIDFATGVYLHSESGGLLVGRAEREEPPGFNETPDAGFVERTAALAVQRVPILERAEVRSVWAGLYEVTPDNHPVLGPVGSGLYAACGFSGHGVMHAPVAGRLLAELLTEGKTSLDISCLRLERFREGRLIPETNVL